jgi:hypothetical protein
MLFGKMFTAGQGPAGRRSSPYLRRRFDVREAPKMNHMVAAESDYCSHHAFVAEQ